jgi:probable glucitol transport protein GutA
MTDRDERLPFGKLVSWAGAGLSAAANFIVLGYVAIYCTDTLGLPAATVGVMVLVSNLANGLFAFLAAYIVDRSPETRLGKARPYEFAVIGTWFATWLLFSTPEGFGELGRTIWVFVTFISINAIFDTLLRANDALYLARAFAGRPVYAKVTTRSGIVTSLGSIALSIVLPLLLSAAGRSPSGWSSSILIVSIPLVIIGMLRFLFIKERFATSDTGAEPVKVREIWTALRGNKWIIPLALLQLCAAAVTGSNVGAYYFRYVVGDIGLQSVPAAFGIILLPSVLAIPWLMKRFRIAQIVMVGAVSGVIGSIILAFAWGSLPLVVLGAAFTGLALLPVSYLLVVLCLDLCTYNESLGNRRLESTFNAVIGIFQKLGQGLAGLLVGVVLTATGYDGTAEEQTPEAINAINALYGWLPAALFTAIFFLMSFYLRFERHVLPAAEERVAARRAALAETIPPVGPPAAG